MSTWLRQNQINFNRLARTFIYIGLLLISQNTFANKSKEDLLSQLSAIPSNNQLRIPLLVELVRACWRSCAADAKVYGEEALAILDKFPDLRQEAVLLIYLPRVYQRDGQHSQAQMLVTRGLKAARALKDNRILANNQFNQAMLYGEKNQFILAENSYFQLYEIYKKLGHQSGMGSALNNLGLISRRLHNYGKALEQYQEALAIYEMEGKVYNVANTLANIGEVYLYLKDFAMAEQSILKAKTMVNVEKYPGVYASINGRLADVQIAMENFELASSLLLENLEIAKRSQVRLADPDSYAKLVTIALAQQDVQQAEAYYLLGLNSFKNQTLSDKYLALDIAGAKIRVAQNKLKQAENIIAYIVEDIEQGRHSDTSLSMLQQLIVIKKLQGKWQVVNQLQELYHETYRIQVKQNQESRLEQFNILYKANEKERKIAELEHVNSLNSIAMLEAEASQRQVIFIAIIVLLSLFVVLYLSMQKRKMLIMRTQLLQKDAEKKTQLFSDISHELRTPLAVLKLQIEGLEHDLVDDPKQTYALLHNKLASINHLITDISQLAQADAGDLALIVEKIKVKSFFEQWCAGALVMAKEKALDFTSQIQLLDKDTVEIDPERIKQVLDNLISNSCRYTDSPGEIRFQVTNTKGGIVWRIEDSAPGPNKQDLPLLFERLYRADKSRSRKFGGSGLGLAICKSLIKAHGGDISVEASQLGGLCVLVFLPTNGGR